MASSSMASQSEPQPPIYDLSLTTKPIFFRTLFTELLKSAGNEIDWRRQQIILEHYSKHGDFRKPYRLLLDASVILLGYDVEKLRRLLQDAKAEIFTTSCVKQEIVNFGNYIDLSDTKVCLENLQNMREFRCSHELGTLHNDCIEQLIGLYNKNKLIVVTASNRLCNILCDDIIKVPIVKLENGSFSLMEYSPTGKTIEFHELIANHKRLVERINYFRFEEKELSVGPFSFYQALAVVCRVESGQKVRTRVLEQLNSFKRFYHRSVEGNYTEFLQNVSRSSWWPTATVCQAVADLFHYRLVILLSYEDQLFFEWFPGRSDYDDDLNVVYLSFLDGHRYTALWKKGQSFVHTEKEITIKNHFYRRLGPKLTDSRFKVCKGVYNFGFDFDENPHLENKLYDRVDRRLKTLGFIREPVVGDGCCCYRSLAFHFENDQEKHAAVRARINEQLRAHPELYRQQIYDEYLEKMEDPYSWGDATTLQGCADVFFCDVVSISCAKEEIAYVYRCQSGAPSCLTDVMLADCGRHNDPLVRDT